jgi:hypothetical protein
MRLPALLVLGRSDEGLLSPAIVSAGGLRTPPRSSLHFAPGKGADPCPCGKRVF